MSVFKPGDRVEIVKGPREGEVTTIASEAEPLGWPMHEDWAPYPDVTPGTLMHVVALIPDNGIGEVVAPPAWLRRLPPDSFART